MSTPVVYFVLYNHVQDEYKTSEKDYLYIHVNYNLKYYHKNIYL